MASGPIQPHDDAPASPESRDELVLQQPTASSASNAPSECGDPLGFRRAAEKTKSLPTTPGVYLMKNAAGIVIYVGKAKNLRAARAAISLKAARQEERTANWIDEICDVDYLECDSEVDAHWSAA